MHLPWLSRSVCSCLTSITSRRQHSWRNRKSRRFPPLFLFSSRWKKRDVMDRQARRLLQSAREEDESLASLVSSPLYLWLQQVSAAGRKLHVWRSLDSGCPRQRSLCATAGRRSDRILTVPSCVWQTCKKKWSKKFACFQTRRQGVCGGSRLHLGHIS